MAGAVSDLQQLLRTMSPVLRPGTYAFVTLPDEVRLDAADVVASIREPEGLSVVIDRSAAERAGLAPAFLCRWITLSVHSDLTAVGLTAAIARALADRGLPCNVVAGTFHDHVFVPVDRADEAMAALRALQAGA
ncbi:MAG: ACT domain-containing protein [Vicinamibacterales bacterium]